MKKLSTKGLLEILSRPGAFVIGLEVLTDARLRKKKNPLGKVFKYCRGAFWTGVKYENAVNREANRQDVNPTFQSAGLKEWEMWLIPGKVIIHKETKELYLRTQSTPNQRRRTPVKLICYRNAKGEFVSHKKVAPYLPKARESAKQQAIGLEQTVWVRNYKFDSIKKIRINGITYVFNA